jgi:phosphoglycerate dehydrogenase-like enzyme
VTELEHALVTVTWPEQHREKLAALLAPARVTWARPSDDHEIQRALRDADAAILAGDADERFLGAPRLRWLHCDHAGIDGFAPAELFRGGMTVTTSAGRSATALGEHALFFMLALSHEAPRLWRAQRRRTWGVRGLDARRALAGRTVGIVGCGHTGSAVAARCKAFDLQVLGYRRRDRGASAAFDEVYARERGDPLSAMLVRSDVLVLAASLNDASRRMIDADALEALPPGAMLVNVARGALVDEDALVHALRRGTLGGAGLDVASVEPLPPTSPIWRAPRTIVTPHSTPRVADRAGASLAIVAACLDDLRAGRTVRNALTDDDVFTRPSAEVPTRLGTRWWNRLARVRNASW